MSPRCPNLSPLYHMPRKMKQDYFVVYSRILMGSQFCAYCLSCAGFGGALGGGELGEMGNWEDYGKKARNFPK